MQNPIDYYNDREFIGRFVFVTILYYNNIYNVHITHININNTTKNKFI